MTESLYQTYRPQTFRQLVGQEVTATSLRVAAQEERIGHAYLFSGPRGCGKTSAARILARAGNCLDLKEGEPCNVCASCAAILSDSSFDVMEYDAASNSGVDSVRDIISKASLATPGKRKFIILDEAHMLSTAAQNALLHTVENPPKNLTFILATTDPNRLLPTVVSRCQQRQFSLVSPERMEWLMGRIVSHSGLQVSAEQVLRAIAEGQGSVRDTLSALEAIADLGEIGERHAVSIVRALSTFNTLDTLDAVATAMADGQPPRALSEDVFAILRECFFLQMGAAGSISTPDWGDRDKVAEQLGARATVRAIEHLGEAINGMQSGGDGRVHLEIALCRVVAQGK